MIDSKLSYDYVLFIDEAGDDGLKRVKPIDQNGASEWLVISGVLVRSQDENNCLEWLRSIREQISATQSSTLHFRKLSPSKQAAASELLSKLPIRIFTVCSNKKNMRGYNNVRAEAAGGKQWFYNWVVRILMERVTTFCARNSVMKHGRPGRVKVVFSARGGHSYGQTKAYWELLRAQNYAGSTFLKKYQMDFRTLSFRLVEYVPHYMNSGLQLADIAASAFYQAVETGSKKWSTICAAMLLQVMAKEGGKVQDIGLVLQPHQIDSIGLSGEQKQIFEYYGYVFR